MFTIMNENIHALTKNKFVKRLRQNTIQPLAINRPQSMETVTFETFHIETLRFASNICFRYEIPLFQLMIIIVISSTDDQNVRLDVHIDSYVEIYVYQIR